MFLPTRPMRIFASAQHTSRAISYIKGVVESDGVSVEVAVRIYSRRYPAELMLVLDMIGVWPSSDPELRALQKLN